MKSMNPNIIYVIVEDGVVTDIKNIPAGLSIQVIDKDVEYVSPDAWEVSPVDGEACCISEFHSYETGTPGRAA